MSADFTPGPWDVVDDFTIRGGDGFTVAVVFNDPNADRDPETADANRRLIRAAPEAYELLAELAGIIAGGGDFRLGPKGKHRELPARLAAYLADVELGR